jgi:hypothetical protein
VSDEKQFQQQVQQIGQRVQELEAIGDPAVRAAAKDLIQLLMEMHGSGLERMLEVIFQSGDAGVRLIDELGGDPVVSGLLVLYGLHPDDLQSRVEQKLAQIRSRLFKMGAEAQLITVNGSDVRVRVKIEGHACGSTSQNVKTLVEEAAYEAAPDLTSLVVEGLEEPAASGFVSIDDLLGAAPLSASVEAAVAQSGKSME